VFRRDVLTHDILHCLPLLTAALKERPMAEKDYETFLSNVGLFQGLSREELRGLDNLTREITYKPGQVVIEQGSPDRDVFLVLEGSAVVEIDLQLDEQKSKRVAKFGPGDFFGEIALVDHEPRSASVLAGDDGLKALVIPHEKLETIMDRNHHVGYVVLKHISNALCERIRAANVQVRDTFTWGRF
jgi:CRP-like cAMP-binding protein